MTHPDQLLDRADTAAMLSALGYKISRQTLAKLACCSTDGPEFSRFCGRALYRAGSAIAWAQARATKPRRTSRETETAAA
jgi:hypothetical protein